MLGGARWYDGVGVGWRCAWGLPAPCSDSHSDFGSVLMDAMIAILGSSRARPKIDTPPHIRRTPQSLHTTPSPPSIIPALPS